MDAVKIAVAKGCRIFERHVGIAEGRHTINGYSSTPAQVGVWVASAKKAFDICGGPGTERMAFSEREICDLNDLYRGVYAKRDIEAGETLNMSNVFYAIPIHEGQLPSRSLSKYTEFVVDKKIEANQQVRHEDVRFVNIRDDIKIILQKMSTMLRDANVTPPDNIPMAISTHYGISRFYEYGTILIDVLNREYCKKILIMMPGQKHPVHYHKVKEETFHVLDGKLEVDFDGERYSLSKGDILTVPRNQKHSFWSDEGAIIDEISTTSVNGDSYYDDKKIENNPNRKFSLTYYSQFMNL
jgi:mannose-6-phosphate isomerase-like protein (cupin superfamily)